MTEKETSDVVLISVSSRIPEFWTDQPSLWFVQFEATVAPQKASDDAQYQLLVAKLGKQVIMQVADLLKDPPKTEKFKALKNRLLHVYEESENARIQKLISDMQLGDQKPSQLLRQMQSLAGTRVTPETLLVMWQNHLPSTVRTVLAATEITDPEKLAAVADKIQETSSQGTVAAVSSGVTGSLADVLAKLTIEVAELRRSRGSSRNGRQVDRASSKSRTRSTTRQRGRSASRDPGLCFYHNRFGVNATKCRKPCTWKGDAPEN